MSFVNEVIQSGETPGWMYRRIAEALTGKAKIYRSDQPPHPYRGVSAKAVIVDEIQDLPPWSGESTVCAKCSNGGAQVAYRKAGEPPEDSGPVTLGETWPERLERECSRCGYRWDEQLNPPQ